MTNGSAVISECTAYRYELRRWWNEHPDFMVWIMLNPSTADASTSDPTIGRCCDYARRWGYSGIKVYNLFALRSTDPKRLRYHPDPIGPENDRYIKKAIGDHPIVAAWGNHGVFRGRGDEVVAMIPGMECFGLTIKKQPVHPLYQKRTAELYPLSDLRWTVKP